MTQLPTLTPFSGQVPNKQTMDKDTFANSVHTYLNYFNDSFVPETNALVTNLIVFAGEIQEFIDTANQTVEEIDQIKTDTISAKDAAVDAANQAHTEYLNAKQERELAKNYANADEDVQVESGYYSAKHYMLKTQAIMAGAVAQLPEGTIDDAAIGTNVTWSSSKIDNELKKFASTASVIDGGSANSVADAIIDGGSANNAA